jgi:hypothetical protein
MTVDCYAQRLLNPFRGAMHTLKVAAAEAVTVDGLHWDIYVSDESLLTAEDRARHMQVGESAIAPHLRTRRMSEANRASDSARGPRLVSVGDIRYGSWSMDTGLRRGPINPSADFRRLAALGDVVYEQLRARYREVPFPFRDTFELWLLDTAGRPLALLHSVVDESEMTFDHGPRWRAGFAAHDRFASPVAATLGASNAGDYLTHYVNDHAGAAPSARWFRRDASGEGREFALRDDEGRTLAAHEFPPLFLANVGHDAAHRQLIEDFLAWQAAWLLVCPCLDTDTRRQLEQCARLQATVVERQYRLYPQMIDEDAIKAALVEAILRRSQPPALRREELLPVHYLEFTPYDL